MYKENAVGNVVAETSRDLVFGTTGLSMPSTGKVRRSPEPSARPSAAADSEERQICTTCFIAESVGPDCAYAFSHRARCTTWRQRCCKRGTGSGDGQRLSLYDYGTTERSFNAFERRGSTLTWTVCTAADSEERKIGTTCLFAESVGLWKEHDLILSPIVEHTAVWEGKRGDLTWQPAVKHQRPAAKPQTATVATAQRSK